MPQDEHTLLLGEIKGKTDMILDKLDQSDERLDKIDSRLRNVETKAAINGAVTGGFVAVGFELIKAKLSVIFGGH
ncbi:MAG TPA: hypothetical protein DCG63_03795 [Methylophilaceae bacterium]|nr:hypothetical protein [Methylophilaceae bacterium]